MRRPSGLEGSSCPHSVKLRWASPFPLACGMISNSCDPSQLETCPTRTNSFGVLPPLELLRFGRVNASSILIYYGSPTQLRFVRAPIPEQGVDVRARAGPEAIIRG